MDNGIKHVGSHFGGIGGMEILLLGPNLPHNWLVNKRSAPVGTDTDYQVVIHFPKSVFGAGFFELAPFAEINELLKNRNWDSASRTAKRRASARRWKPCST